jgi:hypothetical protein
MSLSDYNSFVNVQVHHKDAQPLEVMKLLTIYIMETSRVICDYPMDTVCIVFNLENFTLANMVSIFQNSQHEFDSGPSLVIGL